MHRKECQTSNQLRLIGLVKIFTDIYNHTESKHIFNINICDNCESVIAFS